MQNSIRAFSEDEQEKFLARTIKHLFSYAWVNKADHYASEGGTEMLQKVDLFEARKAHLQFMTRTGKCVGLQELRNLAEQIIRSMKEMGVQEKDIWHFRDVMFTLNINVLSGYFEVDEKRWTLDDADLIDKVKCDKVMAKFAEFRTIEEPGTEYFKTKE